MFSIIKQAIVAMALVSIASLAQAVAGQPAELDSRCIISYDDSHQVHRHYGASWTYPLGKVEMKKLVHCIRLTTSGPVEVEGIAREYVNGCIDRDRNKDTVRHAIEAIVALGVDILSEGATSGGATTAKLTEYVAAFADNTVDCLTDVDSAQAFFEGQLKGEFAASVSNESHWGYWDL